jgi:hypothetical protein
MKFAHPQNSTVESPGYPAFWPGGREKTSRSLFVSAVFGAEFFQKKRFLMGNYKDSIQQNESYNKNRRGQNPGHKTPPQADQSVARVEWISDEGVWSPCCKRKRAHVFAPVASYASGRPKAYRLTKNYEGDSARDGRPRRVRKKNNRKEQGRQYSSPELKGFCSDGFYVNQL